MHLLEQDQAAYDKANQSIAGKQVTINKNNGEKTKCMVNWVRSDSISWNESASLNQRIVPTSDVQQISFKNKGSGAFVGLSVGALIGAVGCCLLVKPILPWEDWNEKELNTAYLVAGACGAVGGGALGLITGAVIGRPVKYKFNIPADSTFKIDAEAQRKSKP